MNESAMNTWLIGLADEAEPIERPEDDILSPAELARLAYLAEHLILALARLCEPGPARLSLSGLAFTRPTGPS